MLLHFRIKSESLHSRFQNWATEDGATAAMCVASVASSASKSSIRWFVITEKAPTAAFTFKTSLA